MANLLTSRKIEIPDTLVHSSGTITATFGTQSYNISVGSPTANTLYFLYLGTISGTTALSQSVSVPSVYQASNPQSIFIGAYYSNGITTPGPQFGSFVNITGAPTTQAMSFVQSTSSGFTSTTQWEGTWWRVGRQLFMECRVSISGNLAAEARFPLPTGFTLNQTFYPQLHNVGIMTFGTAGVAAGNMLANTGNLNYLTFGWQSSAFGGTNSRLGNDTAATVFAYSVNVIPNELSNTPLKDL